MQLQQDGIGQIFGIGAAVTVILLARGQICIRFTPPGVAAAQADNLQKWIHVLKNSSRR